MFHMEDEQGNTPLNQRIQKGILFPIWINKIFSSSLLSESSLRVVEHKSLKWLISNRGFNTCIGYEMNTTSSNISMNTWKSWLFTPWILPFSILALLAKFEE